MDIQIETISTCSAACSFCTYPTVAAERAGNKMTTPVFKKIVDEVATIPQIDLIKITGLSEPTLDPRLEEFIAYCKATAPHARTEMFTHGAHLIPKRWDAIRDAGLDSLVVSLNAVRPEQHEAIMGLKGKFESTVKNVEYAIANAGKCHVELHAVFDGVNFTEADIYTFYAKWGNRDKGGYGMCITEGNWAGDLKLKRVIQPSEHCHRATSSSYVMWDGRMTTCCFDPLGKGNVFGDLKTQSIREVYNSDKYTQFRVDHVNNEADKHPICKGCSRI